MSEAATKTASGPGRSVEVLGPRETPAEFTGWGPEDFLRGRSLTEAEIVDLLGCVDPDTGMGRGGFAILPLNGRELVVDLLLPPSPPGGRLAWKLARDPKSVADNVVIAPAACTDSARQPGPRAVFTERGHSPEGMRLIERALLDVAPLPVVAMPKQGAGRSRTSIPDRADRKAELAARAQRLRARKRRRP